MADNIAIRSINLARGQLNTQHLHSLDYIKTSQGLNDVLATLRTDVVSL